MHLVCHYIAMQRQTVLTVYFLSQQLLLFAVCLSTAIHWSSLWGFHTTLFKCSFQNIASSGGAGTLINKMVYINRPLWYGRLYKPLYKVAETPFCIQGDELLYFFQVIDFSSMKRCKHQNESPRWTFWKENCWADTDFSCELGGHPGFLYIVLLRSICF